MSEASKDRSGVALGETIAGTLGSTAIGTAPGGPSPERVDLALGTLFRGLRIRALLGAGAMGTAYLASHASLRTPVVIKLFRTTVAGADPLAEAHLAARVVSPQVVPVLDAGIEQGLPYVMQRYVDGVDLEELLAIHSAANRSLPMSMLLRIAVDVLHGLSAIHVAGVVHRDIKPPNLFLAGSGEALVGDFGIAVDPTSGTEESVAGTPMFIAPELWSGGAATPCSDLYSTAATLHLLWQRRAPFVADNLAELADLHRDAPYIAAGVRRSGRGLLRRGARADAGEGADRAPGVGARRRAPCSSASRRRGPSCATTAAGAATSATSSCSSSSATCARRRPTSWSARRTSN